jgi:hypothetical protein
LLSVNAGVALKTAAVQLGLPEPKLDGSGAQKLYETESGLLQGLRIIPLFHVPVEAGISAPVRGWKTRRDGSWPLLDIWLSR